MDILDKREKSPMVKFGELEVGSVFGTVSGMYFMKIAVSFQGNAIELMNGVCHSRFDDEKWVIPLDAKLVINEYQQRD